MVLCCGLNENGLHWITGTNIIRKYHLVGGVGFEISDAQGRPSVSLSLPAAC